MDKAQIEIKIARRNIHNLRYAGDTTLMAESEEELKSLLVKVKEESLKSWVKTQHSKNEDRGIWQIDGQTIQTVTNFIFLGSKINANGDCSHEIKGTYSLEEKL